MGSWKGSKWIERRDSNKKFPKKGDLTVCKNWRGILLLSTVSNVFTRLMLNRIESLVDAKFRWKLAGFRENQSCIDQMNSLRIIIEQTMEYQSSLYLSFVDFKKVFDSIKRENMWQATKTFWILIKITNLVQGIVKYRNIWRENTGKPPQEKTKQWKVQYTNGPHSHVLIFYLND
jgi:hypothetical protein